MFEWNESWSVVWSFFWIVALIAYVFALFAVIADLFRDHSLAGAWKAVWVAFLVFLPLVTVLAYLIVRAPSMQERTAQESKQLQAASDQYIRGIAGYSPSGEIAKAKSLVENGTLNAKEYEQIKSRVLVGSAPTGARAE